MEDAHRGVHRIRNALGVWLALFVQLLLAATAVFTFNDLAFASAGGVVMTLLFVALAQRRDPVPIATGPVEPDEPIASAVLVWRALWNLFAVGIVAIGFPLAFTEAAPATQAYLAPHLGMGLSWGFASVLILMGTGLWVAAIRGVISPARDTDEKAGP